MASSSRAGSSTTGQARYSSARSTVSFDTEGQNETLTELQIETYSRRSPILTKKLDQRVRSSRAKDAADQFSKACTRYVNSRVDRREEYDRLLALIQPEDNSPDGYNTSQEFFDRKNRVSPELQTVLDGLLSVANAFFCSNANEEVQTALEQYDCTSIEPIDRRSNIFRIEFSQIAESENFIRHCIAGKVQLSIMSGTLTRDRIHRQILSAFDATHVNHDQQIDLAKKLYEFIEISISFSIDELINLLDSNENTLELTITVHPVINIFTSDRHLLTHDVMESLQQQLLMISNDQIHNLLYEQLFQNKSEILVKRYLEEQNSAGVETPNPSVERTVDDLGMRRIVDTSGERPCLYPDTLATVLQSRDSKALDLPVCVICVDGIARSGKSLLVNLMVAYLTLYEKEGYINEEKWENLKFRVNEIEWMMSEEAVTKGVWVWKEPFFIPCKVNGHEQVAVILVDIEGSGDSDHVDHVISLISLFISSVHILTVMNSINAKLLPSLQICKLLSGVLPTDCWSQSQPFQSLIFLIKDYQGSTIRKEDKGAFQRLIQKAQKGNNADLLGAYEGTRKSFSQIQTFNMSHPREGLATASFNSNWDVQDIHLEFRKEVRELFQIIFDSNNVTIKLNSAGTPMNGTAFLKDFQLLTERIGHQSNLPIIKSADDAFHELVLSQAYRDAIENYSSHLRRIENGIDLLSFQEVIQQYNALTNLVLKGFDKVSGKAFTKNTIRHRAYAEMLRKHFIEEETRLTAQLDREVSVTHRRSRKCEII